MSKKPVVKPKTTKSDTKIGSSRSYSASKDEAHTKNKQQESIEKDEEFARQLQEELYAEQTESDADLARRLQEEEDRHKNQVNMFMPSRPTGRPMSATPLRNIMEALFGVTARIQELDDGGGESTPAMDEDTSRVTRLSSSSDSSIGETTSRRAGRSPERLRRGIHRSPVRQTRGRGPTISPSSSEEGATGISEVVDSLPGVRPNPARQRFHPRLRRLVVGSGLPQTLEPEDSDMPPHLRPLSMLNRPTLGPRQATLPLPVDPDSIPEGELEPDLMVLDLSSPTDTSREDNFINIMRDPFLLMLLLMGRHPGMMIPDDVDASDYEALWDLAERLGDVKPRGMKEEEISKLPTRIYRKRSGDKDSVEECRVCLNGYKSGDKVALLGCKHEYHIDCIKEWLKRNASCPICRQDAKKS